MFSFVKKKLLPVKKTTKKTTKQTNKQKQMKKKTNPRV